VVLVNLTISLMIGNFIKKRGLFNSQFWRSKDKSQPQFGSIMRISW
jgi:hypothetical protein